MEMYINHRRRLAIINIVESNQTGQNAEDKYVYKKSRNSFKKQPEIAPQSI